MVANSPDKGSLPVRDTDNIHFMMTAVLLLGRRCVRPAAFEQFDERQIRTQITEEGRTNIRCIPLIGFGRRCRRNPMFAEREMTIGRERALLPGDLTPSPRLTPMRGRFSVRNRHHHHHHHHHQPLSGRSFARLLTRPP